MSVVSTSLRNLEAFMKDHQISFYNGLLIFFTIAGEQIFKVSAYKCPCEQPAAKYYAAIFFACPTVVLWILGVAVSNLVWRICHGCWNRSHDCKNGVWNSAGHIIIAVTRAAVVPFAWLFVTFLDGNYYACMRAAYPCNTTSPEFKYRLAESQDIAWIALVVLVTFTFMVIFCIRCCDSYTYLQSKFQNSYEELENKHVDNFIQEKTEKIAKENAKKFVDHENLIKGDWDHVSKSADLEVCGKPRSSYLSPLDQWVHGKRPNGEQQSNSGGTEVIIRPLGAQEQQHGDATSPV